MVLNYQLTNNEKESDNRSASHPNKGKYDGINPTRSTTDILFFILIIALWVCMTGVGSQASVNGKIVHILGPIDSQGRTCGYSDGVIHYKYFYTVLTNGLGTCIESCPQFDSSTTSSNPSDYICLSTDDTIPTNDVDKQVYIETFCFTNGEYDITSNCGCNLIRSTESQFRRCRFTDSEVRSYYSTQNKLDYLQSFMADIITARLVIFVFGFLLALTLSFIITLILRYEFLGEFFIWTSIVLVLLLFLQLIVMAYSTSINWQDQHPRNHSSTAINALRAFAIIMVIVSFLYVCCMIFLRKAISISIKTISLAARCIDDMPLIVLTPLIQVIGFVLFMVPLVYYCLYLASDGIFIDHYIDGDYVGKTYHLNPGVGQRLWFMFFCVLWTGNFIAAFGFVVIAISSAGWYFTVPNERANKFNSLTLSKSYWEVLRYHSGTAAFGSLLIALIQFPRYVAMYIQKHSKTLGANPVLKYVLYATICLLRCLESCMKFIAKNAYIQTAIHSTSFIFAAKDAFFLIARNIFQIGAVAVISGIALIILKVFVCVTVTTFAYFYMNAQYANSLHDLVAPTFLVLVISWMTVTMFTDVFQCTIDTIIQCYLTDLENNDGVKAVYADTNMKDFLDKHGKLNKNQIPTDVATNLTTNDPKPTDDSTGLDQVAVKTI